MTREEAIAVLRREIEPSVYEDEKSIAEAIDMAIEALQEVQKHEETFEWCTDCKEYDKDNYCCHRWSKMIRNTVEELKEYSGLVRCKDCRHSRVYQTDSKGTMQTYCVAFIMSRTVTDDDFCSWGERREDAK